MHRLMSAGVFGLVPVPLVSGISIREEIADKPSMDQARFDRDAFARLAARDKLRRISGELMQQPCQGIDDVGAIRGLAHDGSVGPIPGRLGRVIARVEHERDAQVR
jgi:hypothetical protein